MNGGWAPGSTIGVGKLEIVGCGEGIAVGDGGSPATGKPLGYEGFLDGDFEAAAEGSPTTNGQSLISVTVNVCMPLGPMTPPLIHVSFIPTGTCRTADSKGILSIASLSY